MSFTAKELVIKMVCLDFGIVPVDQSVNEAFSEMKPESIRYAKRKYRKLKRKVIKISKYNSNKEFDATKKLHVLEVNSLVRHFIENEAYRKLNGGKNQ